MMVAERTCHAQREFNLSDTLSSSKHMQQNRHDAGTKTTNTSDEELPADVLNMMRNQILVEKCSQLQEGRHSGSRVSSLSALHDSCQGYHFPIVVTDRE